MADEFGDGCESRLTAPWQPLRRPVNGLNLESGYYHFNRCMNQPPVNAAGVPSDAIRWIGSGGSELAFGVCCQSQCPLKKGELNVQSNRLPEKEVPRVR